MSRLTLLLACSTLTLACTATTLTPNWGPDPQATPSGQDGGPPPAADAGTTPPPPPKEPTPDDACNSYAQAFCARSKSCSSFFFELRFGDDAACAAQTRASCKLRLTAPGAAWKPSGAAACATALPSAACDDLESGILPAACRPPPGAFDRGAGCVADTQCAGGRCRPAVGSECGSCDDLRNLGGTCSADADCKEGLACVRNSCRTIARAGEACGACAASLVCKGGVCAKGDPEGSSCASTPSDPDLCDHHEGVFCSPFFKSCSKTSDLPVGGSCGFGSVCAQGGACASGRCTTPLAEGAACRTIGNATPCEAQLVCALGKCTRPDPAKCK